ncbi:hypothetical protein FKM82_021774 [Ascaphus truei]
MVNHLELLPDTLSFFIKGNEFTATYPGGPLLWDPTLGLAFLHQVKYTNGSLLCTQSGVYFVYSKLQLGIRKCPPRDDAPSLFTHGVYKKSPNSPVAVELMQNSRRFCDDNGEGVWRDSSFLGGSFLIQEREEVYVRMSQTHLVRVKDGTESFFGLFMV